MPGMSALNRVIEFCRVVTSSLGEANSATLYNVEGIDGFGDGDGESASDQEVFGALGVISRPLPPEGDLFAEAIAARGDDGLLPFALRDLRIHQAINAGGSSAPAEGQTMFAGYGGAFLSHALGAVSGSKKANVSVIYVPYAFDGDGAPTKAHAIIVDPTSGNSSIQLVHGDGVFFTLTEDAGNGSPGIVWATDNATFGRMGGGEFTVNAEKIMLKGTCYLGAQAESGSVLVAGAGSPPSLSTFVSPV